MYEMKPEYYTGIADIDKEHERLFELAQETDDLLNDGLLYDKADSLLRLISDLINYTQTHFSHEEAYMERIHYANREEHMKQHRKFEESLLKFDIEALEDDYDAQNDAVKKLLNFLVGWLVIHIQEVDMLYTK